MMRTRLPVRQAGLGLLLIATLIVSACGTRSSRTRDGREALVTFPTPGPASAVVVEVFGTSGLRFGGSYGELGQPKSFEGTVPARLAFEHRAGFSIALQKRATDGELGIQVTVDGQSMNRVTTSRPFGVVTYTRRAGGVPAQRMR
jgi:hypothetical protein